MNESATRMSVCAKDQCAWVKIEGRADFHFSETLKKLVQNLTGQGCSRILLDFTHCTLMDSTFAGAMSRLGRDAERSCAEGASSILWVLNANERVTATLENLRIAHLFQLAQRPTPEAAEFKPVDPLPQQPSRIELTRTMLDAHRALVEIQPANFEKFKDVLKFLEEDLKKMEG
jgi:anti-sigma B factor antagonist